MGPPQDTSFATCWGNLRGQLLSGEDRRRLAAAYNRPDFICFSFCQLTATVAACGAGHVREDPSDSRCSNCSAGTTAARGRAAPLPPASRSPPFPPPAAPPPPRHAPPPTALIVLQEQNALWGNCPSAPGAGTKPLHVGRDHVSRRLEWLWVSLFPRSTTPSSRMP